MRRSYRIVERKDNKKLTEYLIKNGQFLMPMVELIASRPVVTAAAAWHSGKTNIST